MNNTIKIKDLVEYLSKLDQEKELFLDKYNWTKRNKTKEEDLEDLRRNLTNKKISNGIELVHTNLLVKSEDNSDEDILRFIRDNPQFGILSTNIAITTIEHVHQLVNDILNTNGKDKLLGVVVYDTSNEGTPKQNHEILSLDMFKSETILNYFKSYGTKFYLLKKPILEDLKKLNLSMLEGARFIIDEKVTMIYKSKGGIDLNLYKGRRIY